MEQPETDSNEQESTPQENSNQVDNNNNSDQPEQESQQQQSSSGIDDALSRLEKKYGISNESEEEDNLEDDPDKEPEQSKGAEPKKNEKEKDKKSDVATQLEEIELDTGEKFKKFQTADGIEIFVTPDKAEQVKSALMKDADYRQKTTKLADERKQLDAAKNEVIRQMQEFQRLQDEIYLSSDDDDDPEPLESEFVDPLDDEAEKRQKIRDYRTKKSEWLKRNEERMQKRADLTAKKKSAAAENDAITKAFTDEFGTEALETIYPELMEIRAALRTTGTVPFPKEMLRKYWLGHNFEKELQKRLSNERDNVVEKINSGMKKSKQLRPGQTARVVTSNDPIDRLEQKYKSGVAGGW